MIETAESEKLRTTADSEKLRTAAEVGEVFGLSAKRFSDGRGPTGFLACG